MVDNPEWPFSTYEIWHYQKTTCPTGYSKPVKKQCTKRKSIFGQTNKEFSQKQLER